MGIESHAERGKSSRLLAAVVWVCMMAAPIIPLLPPGSTSQRCTCAMACCRLQGQATGERCKFCHPDPEQTGNIAMKCSCALTPHFVALVPLPHGVLPAAPSPAHLGGLRSHNLLVSITEYPGFEPALYRPPNDFMN